VAAEQCLLSDVAYRGCRKCSEHVAWQTGSCFAQPHSEALGWLAMGGVCCAKVARKTVGSSLRFFGHKKWLVSGTLIVCMLVYTYTGKLSSFFVKMEVS